MWQITNVRCGWSRGIMRSVSSFTFRCHVVIITVVWHSNFGNSLIFSSGWALEPFCFCASCLFFCRELKNELKTWNLKYIPRNMSPVSAVIKATPLTMKSNLFEINYSLVQCVLQKVCHDGFFLLILHWVFGFWLFQYQFRCTAFLL